MRGRIFSLLLCCAISTGAAAQSAATLSLYPSNPALEPGTTQTFTPLFQPVTGAGPVSWSVSGAGCGGHACGSINESGLYTAASSLANPATDIVTATLVSNTTVTGSTQVTLYLKPVLGSGQSETATAGQSATYNLSLSPGTGDSAKPLTVQCHENTLPTGVSCEPATVQPSANGVSFSFVVQTTGEQTGAAITLSRNVFAGLVLGSPMWLLRLRKRRRNRGWAVFSLCFVTLCILFCLNGCGTNGSFGSVSPKTFTATPSGSYNLEIDGVGPSGTPEEIGTIALTVQ